MPFICENATSTPLYKKAATGANKDHIKIKPLSRPRTALGNQLSITSYFMPVTYRKDADLISQFQTNKDDVWVVGFPKSGTAAVHELIWLILNDCNFDKAKSIPIAERSPLLEESAVKHPKLQTTTKTSMELARRLQSPRVIKTHLSSMLLPTSIWKTNPKIVYIARNPKDVATEYYKEYTLMHGYLGSIDDFIELFCGDCVMYAPFHSHCLDFWQLRNESNILFATYENDIERDLEGFVVRLAEFLNKEISTVQILQLIDHAKAAMNVAVSKQDLELTNKLYKRSSTKFIEDDDDEKEKTNSILSSGGGAGQISTKRAEEIIDWNITKLQHSDFRFEIL